MGNSMSLKLSMILLSSILALVVIIEGGVLSNGNANILQQANQINQVEVPILNNAHKLKLAVVQVQQWLTDISATRGLDGLDDGFIEAENNAQLFEQLIRYAPLWLVARLIVLIVHHRLVWHRLQWLLCF